MPGTSRHDRAGMGLGGVVGLAKIHKEYWLRPPPGPIPFRSLPFRKLLMATSLNRLTQEAAIHDDVGTGDKAARGLAGQENGGSHQFL